MKFCKDCKYAKKTAWFGYEFARCEHPSSVSIQTDTGYMVTGKPRHLNPLLHCSIVRGGGLIQGRCGPSAKFYREKKK